MADEKERNYSRELIGKTIVSKTGKRFGEVDNLIFETRTGELIQLVLKSPTVHTSNLTLEKDKENNSLIPYSSVIAIGDFVVIAEEDIV